jgi:hypothetical protein
MKVDVTNELDQIRRGLIVINSPNGLFRGGKLDGTGYLRRWNSATMRTDKEVYARTGEIEYDEERKDYHVVYRFSQKLTEELTPTDGSIK